MKLAEALEIIKNNRPGFIVHFEHAESGLLRGDYFPEHDEELIPTEEEAWNLATQFAAKTKGRCVNIYVCDSKLIPVPGYKDHEIENR